MTQTKEPKFTHIDIGLLIPTPDNPRKINEKSPKFLELLDSVKREGVRVPVMVRPHPTESGKYDLRAGAKRRRAAEIAKLKVLPALVYEGMTDLEAFDITCIENMGREDLLPLEEVQTVATMLEKHGGDYKVVADKLGKPERWVHLRNNVNKNMAPELAKEIEKEESFFEKWTISHFELLARFDRNTQVRLMKEMKQDYWTFQKISLKDLQKNLNEFIRSLKKAPWKIDDVLTDSKGKVLPVCANCNKRSGCQPGLWDEKTEAAKDDRCLDMACWKNKTIVLMCQEVEKNKALHPDLKLVWADNDFNGEDEAEIETAVDMPIESRHTYEPAKKDDKGAFPVYPVGKPDGKIVWMKARKGSSAASGKTEKKATSLKERKAMLDRKRWNTVLVALSKLLREFPVEKITYEDKFCTVAILISVYGTGSLAESRNKASGRLRFLGKPKFFGGKDCSELVGVLWEMVKPRLLHEIFYNGPITQTPDSSIASAKEIAKLIGVDINALFKSACEEYKEPKTWANLK